MQIQKQKPQWMKCLESVYEVRPTFCHAQAKEAGRSWQVLHCLSIPRDVLQPHCSLEKAPDLTAEELPGAPCSP